MIGYERPFQVAGTVGGGGLLGSLGRYLEPLDYPRQALWNLPRKLAEGDIVGALPGLLGAGAGGAALLAGGGLPLAVGLGALTGGFGQGLGNFADEERFAAPTAADLTGSDSALVNAIVAAAGDPLTYAGGLGGGKLGARAGRGLEEAALARGPMYSAEEGLLNRAIESAGLPSGKQENLLQRIAAINESPYREQILAELEPGARLVGSGYEGMAFERPSGGITRIGGGPGTFDVRNNFARPTMESPPPAPRASAPGLILEAPRDVAYGPYRVEHMPRLETIDTPASTLTPDVAMNRENQFFGAVDELEKRLQQLGYSTPDIHGNNVGRVPGTDRFLVLDPGSVAAPPGVIPPEPTQPPGRLVSAILDMLGGKYVARQKLNQLLARVPKGAGVSIPGAGAPVVSSPLNEAQTAIQAVIQR